MLVHVVPALSALAVLAALSPHRPHRRRAAVGRVPGCAPTPATTATPPVTRRSPAGVVGAAVRRGAGRAPDPAADRRVGRALGVALALGVVEPLLALVWISGVAVASVVRRRSERRRARQALVDELPEVVDLLALATSSGLSVPLAVGVVADRGVGRIAAGLAHAVEVARQGGHLADALDALVDEVGEEVRPLARVLAGSLRDGTEVVPALDRLAGEVRLQRRRLAEERARRLPVQLLFPLVLCVLPAFALLTVVPLLAGALDGLTR